jgi:hypothetical protein
MQAFNRGDFNELDRSSAAPESFLWYSTTGPGARVGDDSKNRQTLVAYFARRHAGRALRRLSFRFNGNGEGFGHFVYSLNRSARDLPSTPCIGKGAAICSSDSVVIAVWGMGAAS